MRPLNHTERNSLTLKFVVVFVVAVILTVVAFHFNFTIKEQLNQHQLLRHQYYSEYQQKEKNFLDNVESLVLMITQLEKSHSLKTDIDSASQRILGLNGISDSCFIHYIPKLKEALGKYLVEKANVKECQDRKLSLERKREDSNRTWRQVEKELQKKIDNLLE